MARRGFRVHSQARFNPFSYQELLAPLAQAQTAYEQMQDNMLTLGEEANVYKQLIDTDPYASGILKGYNDTLEQLSTALSNEGLKSVNRNTLLGIRRKYNNEVKPINDAAKTLAGIQDMYRQTYAKDPTIMRSAMPSIKDLVENPGAMPHMVSGTSLYNQGAQAAKSASSRKQDFSARVNGLVRGYIDVVQKAGYDSAEAAMFLDEASRQPELQAIVNQIYGANQVGNLENPDQGMQWIIRGIFDGLTYDQKADLKYDQYAAEMRAAARASASAKNGNGNTLGLDIKPFNLYSQNERNKARDYISKNINDIVRQNAKGEWELTERGKQRLKNEMAASELPTQTRTGFQGAGIVHHSPSRFTSELEKFYGKPIKSEQDYINAWTAYYNANESGLYDARKTTGYRYIPQADDATIWSRLLMSHAKDGKINTVDYSAENQKYMPDGNTIDAKSIAGIGDIEMTPHGFAMNVWTKDGKEAKVELPPVGGQRMQEMVNMIQTIDNQRDEWTQLMDMYGLDDSYVQNPMKAINLAIEEGNADAYNRMVNIYGSYATNVQTLHDEMARVYRPIDAAADKL